MACPQIDFEEQRFPLNSLKNGQIGALLFSQLYYQEGDIYASM
jgi:hypothetical protein